MKVRARFDRFFLPSLTAGAALALLAAAGGCQSGPAAMIPTSRAAGSEIVLQEGDVLNISFPGAPSLDVAAQPVRRDGKITLAIVGAVSAAGLTPTELHDSLLRLYSQQLVSKEVVVTVVSSPFSVYVDGAALHPGKIVSDRPITALEAIMEAGGFDYDKADTKRVVIIRHKQGARDYDYNTLNLQLVMDGKQRDLYYLSPGDIIHVPQKFSWF